MIFSHKPLMTSFVFLKIHLYFLLLVLYKSYMCSGGSLWSCSMFLSCFHVYAFTALKAILTCVCKIISLKSQRFLRNLSQKKKQLYPLLRNRSFLQQKVHKLTMCCYSHSVSMFSLFCLLFMLALCPCCISVLISQSACQIPSTK